VENPNKTDAWFMNYVDQNMSHGFNLFDKFLFELLLGSLCVGVVAHYNMAVGP